MEVFVIVVGAVDTAVGVLGAGEVARGRNVEVEGGGVLMHPGAHLVGLPGLPLEIDDHAHERGLLRIEFVVEVAVTIAVLLPADAAGEAKKRRLVFFSSSPVNH